MQWNFYLQFSISIKSCIFMFFLLLQRHISYIWMKKLSALNNASLGSREFLAQRRNCSVANFFLKKSGRIIIVRYKIFIRKKFYSQMNRMSGLDHFRIQFPGEWPRQQPLTFMNNVKSAKHNHHTLWYQSAECVTRWGMDHYRYYFSITHEFKYS